MVQSAVNVLTEKVEKELANNIIYWHNTKLTGKSASLNQISAEKVSVFDEMIMIFIVV